MSSPPKPRKSDLARRRILAAAREAFAARGYERSTVREIAAAAQINPSMVIRYFGSKEQLLAAAADLELDVATLSGAAVGELGRALVEHWLARWEDPVGGPAMAALLRAAMSNPAARARLLALVEEQLRYLLGVVGVEGEAADEALVLIASELLGLALTVFVLDWPLATRTPRKKLIKQAGRAVQRHLDKAQ